MLTTNDKEDIHISYLSAVCASASISFDLQRHDNDSTDGIMKKLITLDDGTKYMSSLRIQLKCTSSVSQYTDDISEQDTAVEFIAQWSPVVKTNRCDQDRITLTHDYYQPITMAIEKLRETINTHTKIVGRVKKLESIPDASKRTNGKVTIVYLDENDSKKTVSVQLAKDDYNKAIEAHESGSHVEVIGEIEDNGKRKKLMTAESFSIID